MFNILGPILFLIRPILAAAVWLWRFWGFCP